MLGPGDTWMNMGGTFSASWSSQGSGEAGYETSEDINT